MIGTKIIGESSRTKRKKTYRLSPIFDCGNCFYGKTSDERIIEIMSSNEKLLSSALNGITAYEDDSEKRIRNEDILKIKNDDLAKSIKRVYALVKEKLDEIICFINDIPETFNNVNVMSKIRKMYYIGTLKLRLEFILEKAYSSI